MNTCSAVALSVFNTLPRNGRIAWKRLSLPCFAEPPAESPSTRYNSLISLFFSLVGANLADAETEIDILMGNDANRRRNWLENHVSFTLEEE